MKSQKQTASSKKDKNAIPRTVPIITMNPQALKKSKNDYEKLRRYVCMAVFSFNLIDVGIRRCLLQLFSWKSVCLSGQKNDIIRKSANIRTPTLHQSLYRFLFDRWQLVQSLLTVFTPTSVRVGVTPPHPNEINPEMNYMIRRVICLIM